MSLGMSACGLEWNRLLLGADCPNNSVNITARPRHYHMSVRPHALHVAGRVQHGRTGTSAARRGRADMRVATRASPGAGSWCGLPGRTDPNPRLLVR
jgi:hypothetical protein